MHDWSHNSRSSCVAVVKQSVEIREQSVAYFKHIANSMGKIRTPSCRVLTLKRHQRINKDRRIGTSKSKLIPQSQRQLKDKGAFSMANIACTLLGSVANLLSKLYFRSMSERRVKYQNHVLFRNTAHHAP